MKDHKVDADLSGLSKPLLILECGNCGYKNKYPMKELKKGSEKSCKCGIIFSFSNSELETMAKSLNDLQKTFSSFG